MGGEPVSYRGVTLQRHGRRWRWELRSNGTRVRRSFDTLEAAIAELDAFLVVRSRQRLVDSVADLKPVTVAELLEEWFRYKRPHLAPATERQYAIHIRVHITPLLGPRDANRLRPRDFEDFYASHRWKPAKESHNILRQAFEWGLRNELLVREANPLLVVRPSRRTSTDHDGSYDADDRIAPVDEKAIPKPDEIDKLVVDAELRGVRPWRLYLEVASTTGARPGEVCALQRKHVDVDEGTIRIEWTADRVGGRIKRPKTPSGIRTLHLSDAFFDRVAGDLPADPDAYLFPSNTRAGAVSPLPCWNSRGVKRRLDAALQRCGLPHYTPHAFRHFVATHLLATGHAPGQVARFLGHADDTLVRRLYGRHIVDDAQREIGAAAWGLRHASPGAAPSERVALSSRAARASPARRSSSAPDTSRLRANASRNNE